MAKKNHQKIILIIIFVVLGFFIVGGIIAIYKFYKVKTQTKTPIPVESLSIGSSYITEGWLPYQNSRFGFSLKYPPNFSKQESQNSDGATLTTSDPVMTIRAYGSANVLSQDLTGYLDWAQENLFKEAEAPENAKNILKEDAILGGVPAGERQWTYVNSMSGVLTLVDQVTALKGDNFYNLQMEIAYSDYDEYAAHVFDGILSSYQIN